MDVIKKFGSSESRREELMRKTLHLETAMKLIDNHNATLKEDLLEQIQTGSTMERTPKQKREFFQKAEQPFTKSYFDIFNQIWNAPDKLQSTSWRNTTAAFWSSLIQAK